MRDITEFEFGPTTYCVTSDTLTSLVYCVGQKIRSGFLITCYGKSKRAFWPTPVVLYLSDGKHTNLTGLL